MLWSLVSTCLRSLTDARLEICGAFIAGFRRCQLSQPSPGAQRPLVGLQHILRVYVCCGRDYVCCGQVTEEAGVSMPLITGRGSTFGGRHRPDYLARSLDPRVNFVPLVEHHARKFRAYFRGTKTCRECPDVFFRADSPAHLSYAHACT